MARNIIICCDGTNNEIEENNTNVVRLFRCVSHGVAADGTEQRTYYDPGVGTFGAGDRTRRGFAGKLLGAAFGWGVQRNINDAYRYLMNVYEPGDRVFLFGFSRGAFTVRALSGMLAKCGLLTPGSDNLVPYAARLYNERDNEATAAFFREHFSRPCAPHLIGVFDTVASLGIVYTFRRFFDARLVAEVAYGYHAVSINERRPMFDVTLWDEDRAEAHQTIEQAWFAGVHSDVGGGYARKGLSDIALEWMLKRAEGAGLVVDRRGIEFESDPGADAHESLTLRWRLLGLLTGHWPTGARSRSIPPGSTIHPSVRERMERRPDYDPDLPDE